MPGISPKSPTPRTSRESSEKAILPIELEPGGALADRVQYWGDVPETFNEKVFDDAKKSIKYLVLTQHVAKVCEKSSAVNRHARRGGWQRCSSYGM